MHDHAHMKEWVRALIVEGKWVDEGHIPTTEEHDTVASIIGGANLLPTNCYLGMSDIFTKEAVEWVVFEPPLFRYSCILGRRLNDVVSHKDEQERKQHNSSSVESYMKEYNVNEEYAQNLMYKQVEDAWKDINREYLITKNIPRPLLMAMIIMAQFAEVKYTKKDNFTHEAVADPDLEENLVVVRGVVAGRGHCQGYCVWKAYKQVVTQLKFQRSKRFVRSVDQEHIGRKLGGLKDSTYTYFKVILVDLVHAGIRNNSRINWICNPMHKYKELLGLTSAEPGIEHIMEDLKKEMRQLLKEALDIPMKHANLLKLIDEIQCLGILCLFKHEIDHAFQHIYETYGDN
ncbi:amorpha-4,11-diene synthase [Tanacetum coccineum]